MASGELLNVLQQGARNGTLLSSCEPEVKELMHQLDVLISEHQREWTERIKKSKLQLQVREKELETLKSLLHERTEQLEHLRVHWLQQDQDHKARHADCEAQLVRVRAELTRLRHSYEQLRAKRNQQHQSKHPTSSNVGGVDYKRECQSLRHQLIEEKEREKEMERLCRELRELVEGKSEHVRVVEVEQRQSQQNLAYLEETLKSREGYISQLEEKLGVARTSASELHQVQQELSAKKLVEQQLRDSLKQAEEKGAMCKEELRRMKVHAERKESETVHKLEQRLQRLESQLRESEESRQSGHGAAIIRFEEQVDRLTQCPPTGDGGGGYVALHPTPSNLDGSNERWSKLLENMLGKHFDQLDCSLQKILSSN